MEPIDREGKTRRAASATRLATWRAAFKKPFRLHQPRLKERKNTRHATYVRHQRKNLIQRMRYATMAPQQVGTYNEKLQ